MTIKIYPYNKLGYSSTNWLKSKHHFSFGDYYNTSRMNFGVLRVINDDSIAPQKGFGLHPHKNMEIITYVKQGAITHKDNLGNQGRTEAGSVQVMSAGTGIFHSEYNLENKETILYQIWIYPNKTEVTPRWESKNFDLSLVEEEKLKLLVSGRQEDTQKGGLFIYQDAAIYAGILNKDFVIKHNIKYRAYILASEGQITINGFLLKKGDGAEVSEVLNITIKAITKAELLVIELPED